MTIRNRMALFLSGVAFAALTGCAATPTQESTGQMLDDSVVTTKVKAAIFNETSLKSLDISVTTFRGVVHLTGHVDSKRSAAVATKVAEGVPGVKAVDNELQVQ